MNQMFTRSRLLATMKRVGSSPARGGCSRVNS